MLANERQKIILEKIKKSGAVTTAQLVSEFNVSLETVRRDLLLMEKERLLSRVHGGAIAIAEMQPSRPFEVRHNECMEQKQALARKSTEFISEGDVIGIDAGSTAILFAKALREKFSRLTVITYSLSVFELLCDYKDFSVVLVGGNFLRSERMFYGAMALESLEKLNTSKVFIFPAAVSLKSGICYYSNEEYLLVKKLIENSHEVFVLADSRKLEKKALLKVDDMRLEYHYITDSELDAEIKSLYTENEIDIYYGES